MFNIYLITGATSDIGKAIITSLLKKEEDSKFIVTGYNDKERMGDLIEKYQSRVRYYDVDLSDSIEVNNFVQILKDNAIMPTHFVHLPALPVKNANFKNFDDERFLKDMQLQLSSAIKLCKYILPEMKKNRFGRVLFMQTSYTIGCPPQNVTAYTIVKSGIKALVKSLAVEYAKFGVTVNSVAPSMIETNFIKELNHIVVELSASNNPMGRNATVEDVVPAMEFLLSEESRYITGVTLPITGGSVMF